jgi:hypothetical protein
MSVEQAAHQLDLVTKISKHSQSTRTLVSVADQLAFLLLFLQKLSFDLLLEACVVYPGWFLVTKFLQLCLQTGIVQQGYAVTLIDCSKFL